MEQCPECKQTTEHRPWCTIGYPILNEEERKAEKEIDEKYSEDLKQIKEILGNEK